MNKKILVIAIILMVVAGVTVLIENGKVEAAGVTGPSFLSASSTVITLTTVSTQILGTTTPQGQAGARVTATIQPINCLSGGSGVFLSLNRGAPAAANTGLFAFASSTLILGDHVNQVPNVRGGVQGITAGGTCTVLITEWRQQ